MKLSAAISTTLVFVSAAITGPPTVCTVWHDDPWSTGQEVECCGGLQKLLENWKNDGNWTYRCEEIATTTQTLMNKETQLCLEPAGPLDKGTHPWKDSTMCSFHDIGMDFKQSMRFAECVEGSVQQQWTMEPYHGLASTKPTAMRIRPASNPEYCVTVPAPYYGSVVDPDNHGDFEVWLCQCGNGNDDGPFQALEVGQGKNNSMVLGYWNDSGTYVIGSHHDDKFNADKVSLCDGGWDPDGGYEGCGTHWQADMLQSEKGLDAVV